MKYIIMLSVFLAGCNAMDGVSAGLNVVDVAGKLGVDYDTNGYYTKKNKKYQKICEYKLSPYRTEFRPCQ